MSNIFKEKLSQQIKSLELKYNLNTGLNYKLDITDDDNCMYNIFNEIEKIESCMKRVYDVIEVVYKNIIDITPKELHTTVNTNKYILILKVSKEAPRLDYKIESLLDIIESVVKKELELIKSW